MATATMATVPVLLFLVVLLSVLMLVVADQSSCQVVLTFADGAITSVGSVGGSSCCAYVGGNDSGYKGYVTAWKPDRTCPLQSLDFVRFYASPDCSGAATINRVPSFAPKSVWTCIDGAAFAKPAVPPKFVFRSLANRLCFTYQDGTTALGFPRLLLAQCSQADANSGFSVKDIGGGDFQITDNKGRCLTTLVAGLLGQTAILMKCDNAPDKAWKITSLSPGGKGPYLLRSRSAGLCLSNAAKGIILDECDQGDTNTLFESLKVV